MVILVDGSSYLFRAYHAMPPLLNKAGHPTGAIYGVINMLRKLLNDYHPEYMAVIFDPKGKTFRHDLYSLYKANRTTTPVDLQQQIEPLFSIIRAMGLPLIIHEGVEADDVMGTLAKQADAAQIPMMISTGDKDMAQLVNKNITLINTMTDKILDPAGVQEKFGVPPERMVDYLALVGDTSDNIKGVPGIGPKTAAKLLKEYGDLDTMIAQAESIPGKAGESFRLHLEHLPLCRQLLTIQITVPLTESIKDLKIREPHIEQLRDLYTQYEFKQWLTELNRIHPIPPTVKKIKSQQWTAFFVVRDWDTQSAVGYSFATDDGNEKKSIYLPLSSCMDFFSKKDTRFVGYDTKNDFKIWKDQGMAVPSEWYDLMIESYLLNSHATRWLGPSCNASDILEAHEDCYTQIEKIPALYAILKNWDMPLVPILAQMERRGVLVDAKILTQHSADLGERMQRLEAEAHRLVGHAFNLSSPKQLQAILFTELGLPLVKKTPGGQASTDDTVLQALAVDFELPRLILEYRSLSKLKTTYADKLPLQIDSKTGRIHASYHQALTSTGRLSCSQPNLQNIPIRTPEGRKIRQAFIAPPGYSIVSADYSQIELRIMAHFSQDPGLLKAFDQQLDIHTATAAEIFDVPLAEVTQEQRRRAKTINFGLLYGMSAFGLSKNLGIPKQQAQQYIDRYFERYPQVQGYMQQICATAEQLGYVETLSGRRILIPDIQSLHKMKKHAAQRVAINAPIQGTAADLIKKAMIDVSAIINVPSVYLIMQVHDELVFEVEHSVIEKTVVQLRETMEKIGTHLSLTVPLLVSVGVGAHWDAAH